MITPVQACDYDGFIHMMSYNSAFAVYCARLACFCEHTLPVVDARNMSVAVRAGIVFG